MDLDELRERIEHLSDVELKKEGIDHISDYRDDVQILYKIELKKRGLLSNPESEVIYTKDEEYIKKILSENNLIKYYEIFQKEKILSLEILSNLNDNDYEKIGIKTLGDIKTLQKLFKNKSLENVNFENKEEDSGGNSNNKSKSAFFLIFLIILLFCSIFVVKQFSGRNSYNSSSSSSSSSKDLKGVSASLSNTQIEINTTQTLHDVRIRINGDYIYEVSILNPGTYTAGLATFADSEGNRFNPFTQKVTRITIFCKEGSTGFTPK